MAKKPAPIDLDALHEQLTDKDITYLLSLRRAMTKDRMGWALMKAMESALVDGVDVVHMGEVTAKKRPTPGELFRIRQALDAFDPSDINTAFKNDNKSIADGLASDPDMDIETLRTLATEDQLVSGKVRKAESRPSAAR